MEPLQGVRACVFDAYGTLFDYASASARCRDDLGPDWERLTVLWRDKQLQYTWLRAIQGRHADFWQVTGEALDYALETLGIVSRPLREKLMDLFLSLETFPEVPVTLARLKAAGVKTAILSNGSPTMLAAVVDNAGIKDCLDHVISVEEVGVFKPHPKVYQLAVNRLELPPDAGANELDVSGRPKKLRHAAWFNPDDEPFEHERDAYRPLVWQCRYSGIEVPTDLWTYTLLGKGKKYSDNQAEDMASENVYADFDAWTDRFAAFVARKGKVEPGEFRAFGFTAPSHRLADLRLKWRTVRMGTGYAPAGSSPAAQEKLQLNRDATLNPKQSEGEKLRKDQ